MLPGRSFGALRTVGVVLAGIVLAALLFASTGALPLVDRVAAQLNTPGPILPPPILPPPPIIPTLRLPPIRPPIIVTFPAPANPPSNSGPANPPPAPTAIPPTSAPARVNPPVAPVGPISMARNVEPQLMTLVRGTMLNLLFGGSFAMPIFPDQRVAPTIIGTNVSLEFMWIAGSNAVRYEIVIMAANGATLARSARLEAAKVCAGALCRATVSWSAGSRLEFSWLVNAFDSAGKAYRSLPQAFSLPKRG